MGTEDGILVFKGLAARSIVPKMFELFQILNVLYSMIGTQFSKPQN